MTPAAHTTVRGAEAFQHDFAAWQCADTSVLAAFLIRCRRVDQNLPDLSFGVFEQVVDVPMALFVSFSEMTAEAPPQAVHRASGVEIGPRRE